MKLYRTGTDLIWGCGRAGWNWASGFLDRLAEFRRQRLPREPEESGLRTTSPPCDPLWLTKHRLEYLAVDFYLQPAWDVLILLLFVWQVNRPLSG